MFLWIRRYCSKKRNYGKYQQSLRANIYKIVIKRLIKKGSAYPDFYTKEELDNLQKVQEANKVVPWMLWRIC